MFSSPPVQTYNEHHQFVSDFKYTDAAGFPEALLTCDGVIHKDCSFSFCMSRQGIININRSSSIFSFRKRSKFAKMAEHFEYNHIPAQMSSINHFRVRSVVCFRDSLVVLHLSRNTNSQFGLLDLRINKFLGVFGKNVLEFPNESLAGELSPDKSKCLIRMPHVRTNAGVASAAAGGTTFQLYDLRTRALLTEVDIAGDMSHFCFDPRFTWRRVAVTNFEPAQNNSLSIVDTDAWTVLATNTRLSDTRRTLYPFLKDLCYTRDGSLLIAAILDTNCYCREKKTGRNYRPIGCSIYVFSGETAETLHCVQYQRYTCTQHNCPVNYKPVFSTCGNRMAIVMDVPASDAAAAAAPQHHYVQIYRLPTPINLQNMCRVVILQNFAAVTDLPLPPKLINYLHFKAEFD